MIGRDLEIILGRKQVDVDFYNEARKLLKNRVYIFNSNSEVGAKLVNTFDEIGHINYYCPKDEFPKLEPGDVLFVCIPHKSPRFYNSFPEKTSELFEILSSIPDDIREDLTVVVQSNTKVSGTTTYGTALRLMERIAVGCGYGVARLPGIAESRMNEFYGIARANDLAVVQDNIRTFISLNESVYTLLRLAAHKLNGVWTFYPAKQNSTLRIAKTLCPEKDVVWAENYPQREELLSETEYLFTMGEDNLRSIISYD